MTKAASDPKNIFVNDNRKKAARWVYKIASLAPFKGYVGFSPDEWDRQQQGKEGVGVVVQEFADLNQLAAQGWEPYLMTGDKILLRRDARNAVEDGDRERAHLLATAAKCDDE